MAWLFSVQPCRSSSGWARCRKVQDPGTHTEIMSFIRDGHRSVDVSAELSFEGVSERHIEIMRGELAKIIYDAARTDIERPAHRGLARPCR
jgi:hypothetical protein